MKTVRNYHFCKSVLPLWLGGWLAMGWAVLAQGEETRPNLVIILADDLGWSDVGFNGCREIPTPHLDALAQSGVMFSSGYASHPYCSPSRAGLLTGRYQQRFGHECNPGALTDGPDEGLPLNEVLLSEVLRESGYRTGIVGKWHLGDAAKFWPTNRGFDEWFGFSGGGLSYWGDLGKRPPLRGVVRNGQPVPRSELTHLTDDFSREAVAFIERNQDRPFFLYLAYNAPHAPDHVTREHLKMTEHIEYGGRAVYGAMVAGMDRGIGQVLETLESLQLRRNTLIVFFSDNGGRGEHAVNFPFRGHKGMLFEGGIRVPFCMAWPEKLPAGKRYDHAITALDLFPTLLAAAGVDAPAGLELDGVNLLPYLDGRRASVPHETLFWRYAVESDAYGHAVRHGDFKLVFSRYKERNLLFDLARDPYEQQDLAAEKPEKVEQLTRLYETWSESMVTPHWLDPHGPNVRKEEAARQEAVQRASWGDRAP